MSNFEKGKELGKHIVNFVAYEVIIFFPLGVEYEIRPPSVSYITFLPSLNLCLTIWLRVGCICTKEKPQSRFETPQTSYKIKKTMAHNDLPSQAERTH